MLNPANDDEAYAAAEAVALRSRSKLSPTWRRDSAMLRPRRMPCRRLLRPH